MPLAPGTRLGAYEILSPIGADGMGEVYRAHDTKLAPEPDGQRFLVDMMASDAQPTLDIILNWASGGK